MPGFNTGNDFLRRVDQRIAEAQALTCAMLTPNEMRLVEAFRAMSPSQQARFLAEAERRADVALGVFIDSRA